MDEAIFAIGAIGCFLIGPWILVWLGRRRRTREREEDRARIGELTRRIYLLEHVVEGLKKIPPIGAEPPAVEVGVPLPIVASPPPDVVPVYAPPIAETPVDTREPETFEAPPPPLVAEIPVMALAAVVIIVATG